MKIIIIVIKIAVLSCCASISKVESDCISKLKIAFDSSWILLPDNKHTPKNNLQELQDIDRLNKDCITKLDSSQIIKVLGKPKT